MAPLNEETVLSTEDNVQDVFHGKPALLTVPSLVKPMGGSEDAEEREQPDIFLAGTDSEVTLDVKADQRAKEEAREATHTTALETVPQALKKKSLTYMLGKAIAGARKTAEKNLPTSKISSIPDKPMPSSKEEPVLSTEDKIQDVFHGNPVPLILCSENAEEREQPDDIKEAQTQGGEGEGEQYDDFDDFDECNFDEWSRLLCFNPIQHPIDASDWQDYLHEVQSCLLPNLGVCSACHKQATMGQSIVRLADGTCIHKECVEKILVKLQNVEKGADYYRKKYEEEKRKARMEKADQEATEEATDVTHAKQREIEKKAAKLQSAQKGWKAIFFRKKEREEQEAREKAQQEAEEEAKKQAELKTIPEGADVESCLKSFSQGFGEAKDNEECNLNSFSCTLIPKRSTMASAGTICGSPGCVKAVTSNLDCPKCLQLGLPATYFCSQGCFKSNYAGHKQVHNPPTLPTSVKPAEQVEEQLSASQAMLDKNRHPAKAAGATDPIIIDSSIPDTKMDQRQILPILITPIGEDAEEARKQAELKAKDGFEAIGHLFRQFEETQRAAVESSVKFLSEGFGEAKDTMESNFEAIGHLIRQFEKTKDAGNEISLKFFSQGMGAAKDNMESNFEAIGHLFRQFEETQSTAVESSVKFFSQGFGEAEDNIKSNFKAIGHLFRQFEEGKDGSNESSLKFFSQGLEEAKDNIESNFEAIGHLFRQFEEAQGAAVGSSLKFFSQGFSEAKDNMESNLNFFSCNSVPTTLPASVKPAEGGKDAEKREQQDGSLPGLVELSEDSKDAVKRYHADGFEAIGHFFRQVEEAQRAAVESSLKFFSQGFGEAKDNIESNLNFVSCNPVPLDPIIIDSSIPDTKMEQRQILPILITPIGKDAEEARKQAEPKAKEHPDSFEAVGHLFRQFEEAQRAAVESSVKFLSEGFGEAKDNMESNFEAIGHLFRQFEGAKDSDNESSLKFFSQGIGEAKDNMESNFKAIDHVFRKIEEAKNAAVESSLKFFSQDFGEAKDNMERNFESIGHLLRKFEETQGAAVESSLKFFSKGFDEAKDNMESNFKSIGHLLRQFEEGQGAAVEKSLKLFSDYSYFSHGQELDNGTYIRKDCEKVPDEFATKFYAKTQGCMAGIEAQSIRDEKQPEIEKAAKLQKGRKGWRAMFNKKKKQKSTLTPISPAPTQRGANKSASFIKMRIIQEARKQAPQKAKRELEEAVDEAQEKAVAQKEKEEEQIVEEEEAEEAVLHTQEKVAAQKETKEEQNAREKVVDQMAKEETEEPARRVEIFRKEEEKATTRDAATRKAAEQEKAEQKAARWAEIRKEVEEAFARSAATERKSKIPKLQKTISKGLGKAAGTSGKLVVNSGKVVGKAAITSGKLAGKAAITSSKLVGKAAFVLAGKAAASSRKLLRKAAVKSGRLTERVENPAEIGKASTW